MFFHSRLTKIALLTIISFFLAHQGNAQITKTWPTWAQQSGTEQVANESMGVYKNGYVEKVYNGESYWAMGFYSSNLSLNYLSGLYYGFFSLGSSVYMYANGSNIGSVSLSMSVGDVITVKCSNTRYSLLRNGVEVHAFTQVGSNPIVYPYLYSGSNTGMEESMSFHVEEYAGVTPTWINYGSWRLGGNVLERGQDGGIEMSFDGNNSSYWHLRFYAAKNVSYSSYCVARIYLRASSRQLYMYYRDPNPDYQHQQTESWNLAIITLGTNELYTGARIRLAREGSNFVFYVNGTEKKRVHTDANIDLHPIFLRYYTGQENNIKFTFDTKGGVCDNYFNSKGSYVSSSLGYNYYDVAATDSDWNHVTRRLYNGVGEQVCHLSAEERTYYDDLGRVRQRQEKDLVTDKVWAQEILYGKYGRKAIQTLAAPTGNARIEYRDNFVLDTQGNPYGHNDFEDAKLNSPNAVGEQSNTLGWWYSTNNNEEEWQAVTDYPYSRMEYSSLTGGLRRTASAGDARRMGTGREILTFSMPAGTELSYVYGNKPPICRLAGNSDYDTGNLIATYCNSNSFNPKYIKTITQDRDGKQTVWFSDRNGNEVAKAVSGNTSSTSVNLRTTSITVPADQYRDIHITKRSSLSTSVSFSGSGRNFSIYNLETDALVTNNNTGSSYSLGEGFYRVVNNNANNSLSLSYSINYFDYALEIHDLSGRTVATVAPNNVVYNSSNPNHTAYSLYKFNSLGLLEWEQKPDAGKTLYYNNNKNQVRFTRDAQQVNNGKFRYIKYDRSGRIVEEGECSSLPSGGLQSRADDDIYPSSNLSNVTYLFYDEADASFNLAGYEQKNMAGKLSKTWNDHETIWYGYDLLGRPEWEARKITGALSTKVTQYHYDLQGIVTNVSYQKDNSDEFHHHYAFDARGFLTSSATRNNDLITVAGKNQVRNRFTASGRLQERILGNALETQTFAFNLDGGLKAINPDDMLSVDVGTGGRHPFSTALHHYRYDYKSANGEWKETYRLPTTSTTSTYNNYSGLITGASWKTRANIGGNDMSGHFAYRYRYNIRNELDQAYFATVTPYSNSNYVGQATFTLDYYNYLTYDKNGNIDRNIRRAVNTFVCSSSSRDMDYLYYRYNTTNGKNQLQRIDDIWTNQCIPGEITDQGSGTNYYYNEIGQLTRDVQANAFYEYDFAGRIAKVYNGSNNSAPLQAEYYYGPNGKQVKRKVYNGSNWTENWYVYEDTRLMGIYESSNACGGCNTPAIKERPLYGNNRIGLAFESASLDYHYEIGDHLGNVRAVIREAADASMEVVRYVDYYPQGWALPARNGGINYRYAFQGQFAEQQDETGWIAFDSRSIDPRIGRWMTIDPARQYHSPYVGMWNNPVNSIDDDGEFGHIVAGFLIGAVAKGASIVINDGWGALKDGRNWAKIGLSGVEGAVVAAVPGVLATGGIAAISEFGEQTIDNIADHGSDYSSYEYNPEKVLFAGVVGVAGGVIDDKIVSPVANRYMKRMRDNAIRRAVYGTTKGSVIAGYYKSYRTDWTRSAVIASLGFFQNTGINVFKDVVPSELYDQIIDNLILKVSNLGNQTVNDINMGFPLPEIVVTPDGNGGG